MRESINYKTSIFSVGPGELSSSTNQTLCASGLINVLHPEGLGWSSHGENMVLCVYTLLFRRYTLHQKLFQLFYLLSDVILCWGGRQEEGVGYNDCRCLLTDLIPEEEFM